MKNPFKNKSFAVFGLGKSGIATARKLRELGAQVHVDDDNQTSRAAALSEGFQVIQRPLGKASYDAVILSPGIPLTHPQPHPIVTEARQAEIPVRGDIDLFMEWLSVTHPKTKIIAITGTNGKSTTTALTGHILQHAGKTALIAGNIGLPIWAMPEPDDHDIVVMELSSYQIDLSTHLTTHAAVFLNLSPDHLDRHGSIESYGQIKERLVMASHHPIVVSDDTFTAACAERLARENKNLITVQGEHNEGMPTYSYNDEGDITHHHEGKAHLIARVKTAQALRGRHNAQNAAAAVALVKTLGLSDEQIQRGLNSFAGLAHRMERVAQTVLKGQNDTTHSVIYINDSKATNAAASEPALKTFNNIFWLAGGLAKTDGIDSLLPYTRKMKAAFLFGKDKERFANTLEGHVETTLFETLGEATRAAVSAALKQQINNVDSAEENTEIAVLLSPASASFDAYPNFEVRGEDFRNTVLSILGQS